ncbi:putative reverse transcriptase domain-containing protein [Tanacetum coccineum]|uniref:Reverse transcriptase domain-containing protein n=1 Tax=Tanacetum coccineum TaxID=301880 RepID=A0ABQ5I744_9ASTR
MIKKGWAMANLDSLFSKGLRTVKSIPPKCRLGFSRVLKGALDKVIRNPDDISCWVSLLALPLCLLKTFHPRSNLECKSAIKRQRQEKSIVNAIRSWGTPSGSLQLLRETLTESSPTFLDDDDDDLDLGDWNIKQCKRKICDGHYTAAVRVLSSSGVAPYNEATLEDLKTKHPFHPAPYHIYPLIIITSSHLRLWFWTESRVFLVLISSITQVVNLFLAGNCLQMLGEYIASAPLTPLVKLSGGICPIVVGTVWRRLVSKFGVGVAGGSESILHSVNRLIEAYGGDVGLSMLLVDFKNAFNLVDREVMLHEVRLRYPAISRWVKFYYSNTARLYYGDHTLWSCQRVQQGDPLGPLLFSLVLHPLICKIRDSFSLSLHAWYLEDGTIIGDTVVVGKVLELIMEDRPGCGLHLNVDKTEVFWPKEDPRSRLTGPLVFFESAQRSFDVALRSSLKRISADLQTKLLRHIGIVSLGPTFDDALSVFNKSMKTDLLSNSKSTFSLSPRQMALWTSQREDYTSDWLRTVPISGLGQTMNNKTYRCVLCYRLGIPLFSGSKPCSACSKVFAGDIYEDHAVSCAGIIGIKHRHNIVRDTLVDICYRSGISAGKEVDIGLDGGRDKPLCPADILLYSWDGGLDVCMDLTGSSPLTQTGMVDFVPGRAVIDVAQRKRGKYMDMCAANGYGVLPFSFSSLGELEADDVTLLKRIRKFSITQDIGAHAAIHIFRLVSLLLKEWRLR